MEKNQNINEYLHPKKAFTFQIPTSGHLKKNYSIEGRGMNMGKIVQAFWKKLWFNKASKLKVEVLVTR